MEDIIKTILDVVRVQHSATEGTEEKPFDMEDIVDMAMGVMGRPEEPEEESALTDSIHRMVESLAPDIFPPKTFEQMDDEEKTASVTSMLENRLKNGFTSRSTDTFDSRFASVMGGDLQQDSMDTGSRTISDPQDNGNLQSNTDPQDNGSLQSNTDPQDNGNLQGNADPQDNGDTQDNKYAQSGADVQTEMSSVAQASEYPDFQWEQAISDAVGDMAGGLDPQETADLNDMIYKNLMEMMGTQTPRVEFPFDRSQIRYGQEKSFTQQLQEEQENKQRADKEEQEKRARVSAADLAQSRIAQEEPKQQFSAYDMAQNVIDKDEEAHKKEPYIPKPIEEPQTKSASQLAAEAIARAQEEDKMKLEIEKQAEALMAEAAKRGQDPMKFALHQQEILQYMEKNSDELVSFEDYEDLSPEEKLEIERQIYIDKQIEEGVDPDKVDTEVPEEYIPSELKAQPEPAADQPAENVTPVLSEDMLRMLSEEVVRENSDMILAENADEDIESLHEAIFANLKQMMAGGGEPVPQEDVGDLIDQVIASNREHQLAGTAEALEAPSGQTDTAPVEAAADAGEASGEPVKQGMSAVELAKAAQKAAKPEPKEVRETRSAADIAREAQEKALAAKQKPAEQTEEDAVPSDEDLLGDLAAALERDMQEVSEASQEETDSELSAVITSAAEEKEEAASNPEKETLNQEDSLEEPEEAPEEGTDEGGNETAEASQKEEDDSAALEEKTEEAETDEDEEEYEYVDPDEMVLGEHTQAEIDEALDNLSTLGLEGEVYERAKRMLLLELAGSEAELDAWLKEQEHGKKKKAAVSSLNEEDIDDISDLDHEELEKELELAMDEDFMDEFDELETSEEDALSEDLDESGESPEDSEEEPEDSGEGQGDSEEEPEDSEEGQEDSEEEPGDSEEGQEDSEEKAEDPETLEEETEIVEILDAESDVEAIDHEELEKSEAVSQEVAGAGSQHGIKGGHRKKVVRRKEKTASKDSSRFNQDSEGKAAEEKGYQVSTRKPFILKNSASFMDQFEDYIADTQENRKLSTGFKKLDAMLRYGLHKGSYFIDAQPQYLKNGFMQQIADRAAESGIDVLYISTELSRYDLMVETISRLSFEIHQGEPEKAVSAMAIMTGEDGADLASLKDELNWYRGRISEHLFILDQEAVSEYANSMEDASAGVILTELISSIVREGAHKPVVFIDNIENILSTEDSDDMRPLMEGIRKLAGELGIPILMSYGYAQAESEEELYPEEREYHESLGNMCDVYLELQYADMITEDSLPLTVDDIREMVEEGESLLIDVFMHKNRRPMKASLQIQGTPKYNFFEE